MGDRSKKSPASLQHAQTDSLATSMLEGNGDSFDSNDSWDTGLFTDTSGNIAFDNGDQVSFENVESFSW